MRSKREVGQVMVEYVLITVVVALALLVPQALTDNMSVGEYFARAVRAFFRAWSVLLSTF
jgi:hypothetical protein